MEEDQETRNQRPLRINRMVQSSRVIALFVVLLGFSPAHAAEVKEKWPIDGIADNSFLIEEVYNQEASVVQRIFTAQYGAERNKQPRQHGWTTCVENAGRVSFGLRRSSWPQITVSPAEN